MRNKPKINPTSAKILHSSGKAQVDRLHQPIGRISNHTMSTMEKHTYKPQISSASREMLRGHHHAPAQNNIYNRNLAWEAAKQERIQHEQQCRLEDELAECSFAPRISGHAEDGRIDRGTGMVDRHYEWMQRRYPTPADTDALSSCSLPCFTGMRSCHWSGNGGTKRPTRIAHSFPRWSTRLVLCIDGRRGAAVEAEGAVTRAVVGAMAAGAETASR